MTAIPLVMALSLLLGACATVPDDTAGKLPADGLEAARYVDRFCALDQRDRNGQQEALRRALWPRAQLIILCDH